MSGDKQNISTKLNVVITAACQAGARQGHLLDEHGEAVAGGGEVELQVTFEGLSGQQQTGVECEDGDDLLLHVKPGFASVGGTNLVKSANIKRKINNISDSDLLIFHLRRQLRERESPTVCKFN